MLRKKTVERNKEFSKRYGFGKGISILLVLICIICLIIYITVVVLYNLNVQGLVNMSRGWVATLEIVKDILLTVTSILSVNLIASVVIEVKNKNKLLSEFFSKDIISSPEFYSKLDKSEKNNMLRGLQMAEYFNNNEVFYDIHSSIIETFTSENSDYYFEKCEFIVNVKDMGEYFEKTTRRTIYVRSYDKKKTCKNFHLAKVTMKEVAGQKNFEIKELKIGGKPKPLSIISDMKEDIKYGIPKHNGYNTERIFYLKDSITFHSTKVTEISLQMINRCPKDDLVSSYRATVPCKNFSVEYVMNDKDKYRVVAYGFGFMNDARQHPSNYGDNGVKLELSDWVLKDNGIVISTVPK